MTHKSTTNKQFVQQAINQAQYSQFIQQPILQDIENIFNFALSSAWNLQPWRFHVADVDQEKEEAAGQNSVSAPDNCRN
jgi:hypothetical protein